MTTGADDTCITSPWPRLKPGDYEGAMGTAQLSHAPGNDYRDKVFGRVVDSYREAWKLPEALGIAERIYHDNWRRQHLYNLAMAQIEAGDYEGAMGTAQLSHAPGERLSGQGVRQSRGQVPRDGQIPAGPEHRGADFPRQLA